MFNPAQGGSSLREQAEAGGGHQEVAGRGGVGGWGGFPEFAQFAYSSHFQNLLPTYPLDLCSRQEVLGEVSGGARHGDATPSNSSAKETHTWFQDGG